MGMMHASKLDRRITILRSELIDDGYGQTPGPYEPIGTVWAHRKDISDGEKFRAAEVQANISTRFTVRSSEFSRGIDPKDRIQHGGLTFDLVGVKESADGRLSFIELTCAARIDGASA